MNDRTKDSEVGGICWRAPKELRSIYILHHG